MAIRREDASSSSCENPSSLQMGSLFFESLLALAETMENPAATNISSQYQRSDLFGTDFDHNEISVPSQINMLGDLRMTPTKNNQKDEVAAKNKLQPVDLSKTPQKKPRRRKHRPKVIIEGQRKKIPKPRVEKTSVIPKSMTEKKYVRRNKANKHIERATNETDLHIQVPDKPMEGTSERKGHVPDKPMEGTSARYPIRSCRRLLKFNLDDEVRDESSSFYASPIAKKCHRILSPSDSICSSNNLCLTPKKQDRSLKRKSTVIEAETCNQNETGILNNPLQAYGAFLHTVFPTVKINNPPGLHFPKKKRTEKRKSSFQITAITLNNHGYLERTTLKYSRRKLYMLPANHEYSSGHRAGDNIKSGRRRFEDLLALVPTQRIRKRRSEGRTRRRDLASLLRGLLAFSGNAVKSSKIRKESAIPHGTPSCMETLAAATSSTVKRKKRSKRIMIASSLVKKFYYHHNSASASTGTNLALKWKSMQPMDIIIEKLSRIDLNANSSEDSERGNSALVPYNGWNLDQPIVPYQHSGAIVSFDDQVKRKRSRAKVNLDDETNKVWKLLLENINNEGVDGTDEDKAKWWEEERRVFRGRADSFIARMHLVQGDRRFSPWKGSVVDSVVGVFLTQNVSDHLSSSAFMSMAARYALKVESCPEENLGRKPNEPEVFELDPVPPFDLRKEILNQPVCGEDDKDNEIDTHEPITLIEDTPAQISFQNSTNFVTNTSREEPVVGFKTKQVTNSSCFVMTETFLHKTSDDNRHAQSESLASNLLGEVGNPAKTSASCCQSISCCSLGSGAQTTSSDLSQNNNFADAAEISELSSESTCRTTFQKTVAKQIDTSNIDNSKGLEHKEVNSNKNYKHPLDMVNGAKTKGGKPKKEKEQINWDHLRKDVHTSGRVRERTKNTMDSVDWEAVRCSDVNEIAETIKERGMNNMLAERIKDFLNRMVRDHGSIDLEWLRDVPPDKAKEYLLSIRGLGLKSVECIRLLTLRHLAFPVDTNVGRITVRLGWVPLQPLPESLQLHFLELYPILDSIQKFLWPRLCKLDEMTLYELHYQMITFGKVFCTKNKPNCNACPMRGECRHFASAFASARLSLPAPQEKSIVSATENGKADEDLLRSLNTLKLPSTQTNEIFGGSNSQPIIEVPLSPEPIIEMPASPEPDQTQGLECDIENAFDEDPDEIPTINLNIEEFTHNLQSFMHKNAELEEGEMSKALVALTSAAASIPMPKLKNMSRLRTEHQVYELPDTHPLLQGMDVREADDPSPYLLAIWTPGETMDSIEPPERRCSSQQFDKLCSDKTCSSCNSIREANSQTVRGTILIPCRTAMKGSFPLNGTYFQVNEVFSDHESSLSPIDVPRAWLWNLNKRTVYFGTSIPTIFRGLSTEGIQYCFWRGFVCVRGFDRVTRAPRPLIARLHFPASRLPKGKGKINENA